MSNLTDKQLKQTFDLFDADGSGAIDGKELGMVLEGLGFGKLPTEEVEQIVRQVDRDLTGVIEFDEFKRLCKGKMAHQGSAEEVHQAFIAFDFGGKGKITSEDFCAVAEELGEDVKPDLYREIIREACGPNTDSIGIDEWRQIHSEVTQNKHRMI
eukprot:TRINITY_DN723_c0_g1_i1.p1 TRINITY_DN723_c0_g1~~TRINITY_DN723_c0_g1_i1.p1  ORF type:complete len:155 (+),score=38.36 TRINITY_DN723_c0_g1_i1:74-538(+)